MDSRLQLHHIEERLDGQHCHSLGVHKAGSSGDVLLQTSLPFHYHRFTFHCALLKLKIHCGSQIRVYHNIFLNLPAVADHGGHNAILSWCHTNNQESAVVIGGCSQVRPFYDDIHTCKRLAGDPIGHATGHSPPCGGRQRGRSQKNGDNNPRNMILSQHILLHTVPNEFRQDNSKCN